MDVYACTSLVLTLTIQIPSLNLKLELNLCFGFISGSINNIVQVTVVSFAWELT